MTRSCGNFALLAALVAGVALLSALGEARAAEPPPLPTAQASERTGPPPLPGTTPPPLPSREAGTPPSLQPAADGRALPPLLRLQRHVFYDRQGFGHPVEAAAALLPADWQVEGEIVWAGTPSAPSCMSSDAQLLLRASSSDGLWGVEVLPAPKTIWYELDLSGATLFPGVSGMLDHEAVMLRPMMEQAASNMHRPGSVCRLTSRTGIEGLAEEAFLPSMRPGARIIDREPVPEMLRVVERGLSQTPSLGLGIHYTPLAESYRLQRQTPVGPVEEALLFAGWRTTMRTPLADGSATITSDVNGFPVMLMRHPVGAREQALPVFNAIFSSMRFSPRWEAAMARHRAKMSEISRKGAADRSAIWAETSREISDMQMEGWKKRQQSADRMMALTSDQIREVRPLRDPQTGEDFELPQHYETFYRNPQGEILMSTNPEFQAHELFPHENWVRLENAPR